MVQAKLDPGKTGRASEFVARVADVEPLRAGATPLGFFPGE